MWILRRKGGITAKRLASIIGCRASKKFLPRRREFIVNYGKNYNEADLNTNVNFNKFKVQRLLEENGIRMPKIFIKNEEIPDEVFPILARKQYHSQGRDIIYIHNKEHFRTIPTYKYDFLTEYINKKSEYRVHILGNEIAFVNIKFDKEGYADPIVRNKLNGWKQISYEGIWKDKLIELAKNTIKILRYDFGAVDIIRKGKKLYVLEVNSAPGLEKRKLQIYADYLKKEELKWKRII